MWSKARSAAPLVQRFVASAQNSSKYSASNITLLPVHQRRSISLESLRKSISTFPHSIIEEQPDIKMLDNVNAIVTNSKPMPLGADDTFVHWINERLPEKEKSMTKEEFDQLIADAIVELEKMEVDAWKDIKINDEPLTDQVSNAAQNGLNYLLLKYKYKDVARYFDLLDNTSKGSIQSTQLRTLLDVYTRGDAHEWFEKHFNVLDTNRDGLVSENEMQQLLLNILGVHKSVLKELVEKHSQHWTKKHSKQFTKAITEYEIGLKVSEKIRCTWHFAGVPPIPEEDKFKDPPPVPPRFTMSLPELKTSLNDEFSEFDKMFEYYTRAITDARCEFYESRNSKRTNYLRGTAFLLFCGVTDFVMTILV